MNKIKQYLKSRTDVGEEGFWVDPIKEKVIDKSKQDTSDSEYDGAKKAKEGSVHKKLDDMKKIVLKCTKCPLGYHRLNACFGNGNSETKILFIGEGPGYEEDHTGNVFVGRAGKLLDSILLEAFNFTRSDVYITNIVKCHPMKDPSDPEKRGNDRPPTDSETQTCIDLYLIPQIKLIKPQVIVTLGSPATKTILDTSMGITSLRGKIFDVNFDDLKVKVVPTYHPAYLLRNPPKKKELMEDTKVIKSLL